MLGRVPAGSDVRSALLQNPTQPACAGNKGLARHLGQPGRLIRWRRDSMEGGASNASAGSLQERPKTALRGVIHALANRPLPSLQLSFAFTVREKKI